jgi:hypothetical protein
LILLNHYVFWIELCGSGGVASRERCKLNMISSSLVCANDRELIRRAPMMDWLATFFGAACLTRRYRWIAYVGCIGFLAHDAIWPAKAKDPATPVAPVNDALPDTAAHGKDGQSSTSTGAQMGRGWQPDYDPNAPAGPYGTEETTPTAPATPAPGRVPVDPTCITASGLAGPCPSPGGASRMPRGYARPYGAYRATPRGMDNGGGGGRN